MNHSYRPPLIRYNLIRRSLELAILFALSLTPSACGRFGKKDVTNDGSHGNFAAVVGTWKVKSPLWLMTIDKTLYLNTDNIHRYPTDQELSLLPVGTEIRIEHLIHESTFETDYLYPTGTLTSGPYAGQSFRLADSLFITNLYMNHGPTTEPATARSGKWAVAPEMLEK